MDYAFFVNLFKTRNLSYLKLEIGAIIIYAIGGKLYAFWKRNRQLEKI